jgi:hypothetical protein
LTSAGPALSRCGPWLRFGAFTGDTEVSAVELQRFGATFHSLHEVDLDIQNNVVTFGFGLLLRFSVFFTEHPLELIKHIAETPSFVFKILCEVLSVLRVLRVLLLFIALHSGGVVNPALLGVA